MLARLLGDLDPLGRHFPCRHRPHLHPSFYSVFFFFQSLMAARIASSANTEQWIFTGGSASSFTMSVFLICSASSTVLPFTHSVANEEKAMAEPQPKVLNLASSMLLVAGFTRI